MAPVFIPPQKLASFYLILTVKPFNNGEWTQHRFIFIGKFFLSPVTYGETTKVKLHMVNEGWPKAETEKEN
jgi:hypothetical protein